MKNVEVQKHERLELKEQGFGSKSVPILASIIRNKKQLTLIDLSYNKIGSNFKPLIDSIKMNLRIVALKLCNNEIQGSQHSELIRTMIQDHPSLTNIDFSNLDNNKNRNKLSN